MVESRKNLGHYVFESARGRVLLALQQRGRGWLCERRFGEGLCNVECNMKLALTAHYCLYDEVGCRGARAGGCAARAEPARCWRASAKLSGARAAGGARQRRGVCGAAHAAGYAEQSGAAPLQPRSLGRGSAPRSCLSSVAAEHHTASRIELPLRGQHLRYLGNGPK
jgi:hypothetical protein